jgi:hypothetical protein
MNASERSSTCTSAIFSALSSLFANLLLTIPEVLSFENLETLPSLENGLSQGRDLDTSRLYGPFPYTVNCRWRNNCSGNIQSFLGFKNCHVDISMNVTLDPERRDFNQVGDVIEDVVRWLACINLVFHTNV